MVLVVEGEGLVMLFCTAIFKDMEQGEIHECKQREAFGFGTEASVLVAVVINSSCYYACRSAQHRVLPLQLRGW